VLICRRALAVRVHIEERTAMHADLLTFRLTSNKLKNESDNRFNDTNLSCASTPSFEADATPAERPSSLKIKIFKQVSMSSIVVVG
jgi:hypothetical protein